MDSTYCSQCGTRISHEDSGGLAALEYLFGLILVLAALAAGGAGLFATTCGFVAFTGSNLGWGIGLIVLAVVFAAGAFRLLLE